MEKIEQAVLDFVNNEDLDQGEKNLRISVTTLSELRFAVAEARQKYPDEVEELIECLISL